MTGDLVAKVTAFDGITTGLLGGPVAAKDDYLCMELVVTLVGDAADIGAYEAASCYCSRFATLDALVDEAGASLSIKIAGVAIIGGGLALSSGSLYPRTLVVDTESGWRGLTSSLFICFESSRFTKAIGSAAKSSFLFSSFPISTAEAVGGSYY